MDAGPLVIPPHATAFGFSLRRSGGHLSRSLMLPELRLLFASVPVTAGRADYRAAIRDENVLGKPTFSSRQKSKKHLYEPYGLDPALALFRLLRRFATEDPASLPLLALTCAFCRDPQLRASFDLIETLKPGEVLTRPQMVAYLEEVYPERYSPVMLSSLATRLGVTWAATGHLKGTATRTRALPVPTPAACSYTMFAGYLLGLRGDLLVSSVFTRLVGADPSTILSHLAVGSQNDWLRLRHGGGVTEIDFSGLLLPDEEALLNGTH
ncbi:MULTISPECIES: hypothetical protein [unclassified Thiocapsa]|uniref:hypothetical protein n=1 Tax=unclassified Thiocapsa TaxID=2641286 RepID=UPI0035B12B18